MQIEQRHQGRINLSHKRGCLRPVITAPGPLVAIVVQCAHVARIERCWQFLVEVGAYIGQVVADVVTLCGVVDFNHFVVAG